ncbi:MAG: right-handed parallel beta-helix repeat-containing protein [Deltaproteobacteria bacterium]|nr:right-handed parallel beta-helix repeat-containing protein [Deltaproteobacteria bacterium]
MVPGDHATIQAAVDDLSCDPINVKAGTYTEEITIARDVTLKGVGGTSIIKAPGSFVNSPRAILHVTSGATATIEKFKITGPGPADDGDGLIGVFVDDGATATIRNNTITTIRPPGAAIGTSGNFFGVCVGSAAMSTTGTATIVKNTIGNYQGAGIVVDGTGSSATIGDNTVLGTGLHFDGQAVGHGIQISRGAGADVSHNRAHDNNYQSLTLSAGILVFDAGDSLVTLTHNTTLRNDIGIWVVGTDDAVIERNGARDSVYDGITLDNQNATDLGLAADETTDGHSVRNNSTTFNGGAGIAFFSSNNNTISDNTSSKNADAGLLLTCECDYTVNPFCAPGCGISSDFQLSAHDNTVSKNKENNGGFGIVDESTGGAGPGGVDNTYTPLIGANRNICKNNSFDNSSPDGLCQE